MVPYRIIKWNVRASQSHSVRDRVPRVSIWVNVQKLDALLPIASEMVYVGFAGENGIRGKYAGVDEFVRSPKCPSLLVPDAEIERACDKHPDRDLVYIFNGRHTFAWMRDHGAQALPVLVAKHEAGEVAHLVGTRARECRVTMDFIPEFKPSGMN